MNNMYQQPTPDFMVPLHASLYASNQATQDAMIIGDFLCDTNLPGLEPELKDCIGDLPMPCLEEYSEQPTRTLHPIEAKSKDLDGTEATFIMPKSEEQNAAGAVAATTVAAAPILGKSPCFPPEPLGFIAKRTRNEKKEKESGKRQLKKDQHVREYLKKCEAAIDALKQFSFDHIRRATGFPFLEPSVLHTHLPPGTNLDSEAIRADRSPVPSAIFYRSLESEAARTLHEHWINIQKLLFQPMMKYRNRIVNNRRQHLKTPIDATQIPLRNYELTQRLQGQTLMSMDKKRRRKIAKTDATTAAAAAAALAAK